jgi:hypothetical protein
MPSIIISLLGNSNTLLNYFFFMTATILLHGPLIVRNHPGSRLKSVETSQRWQDKAGRKNRPACPFTTYKKMVEAAGIEPASKEKEPKEPTCLVGVLNLGIQDTHRPVSFHPSLLIFDLPYRHVEELSH